jgi:hypothetical protein
VLRSKWQSSATSYNRSGRGRRDRTLAIGAFVCALTVPLLSPLRVRAAEPEPPDNFSFYVNTTSDSTLYQLGWNQGHSDAINGTNSLVILDFGGQNQANTGTVGALGSPDFNYSQIEVLCEFFLWGYYNGTGLNDYSTVLTLAVGTSDGNYIAQSLGTTWGQVVQTVENWIVSTPYSGQETAIGANDIETFGGAHYSDVLQWLAGYESGTKLPYEDYGSADGCPQFDHTGKACTAGPPGWTQYSYWYLSWGATPAHAFPIIYRASQKDQWVEIDEYGYLYQGDEIDFTAPLNDYYKDNSTYTPAQSWGNMVGGLEYYGRYAYMPYQGSILCAVVPC